MTAKPQNPFYNTAAVRDPYMFFGRTQLLRRLYSAIVYKQCISLVGSRHIGKSSILRCVDLQEIQQRFEQNLNQHILVFIDLREYFQKTSQDFFAAITQRIMTQCRGRLELSIPDMAGEDKFSAILDQIEGEGFYTVLLIYAFDNITRNKEFDADFFGFLRSQAGKVSYVTASIAPLYEVCHNDIEGSPFFNIFSTHSIEALQLEEARELVSVPASRVGHPFTEAEIDWVIKMAGRHPFFLQRVSHFLFEEKSLHTPLHYDLKNAKSHAYHDLEPHFAATWERLSIQEQEVLKDEARQAGHQQQRQHPELSESALFRLFVREKCQLHLFRMTTEEVEKVLDKIYDARLLGESNLRYLKIASLHLTKQSMPSIVERGIAIRAVLNEALERLRGTGIRRDGATRLETL